MKSHIIKTPISNLELIVNNCKLEKVNFTKNQTTKGNNDPFINKIKDQLNLYFKNPQHQFDLPLSLQGTLHQKQVWQILTTIPSSTTMTYGDIAKQLKSSAQAVGNACRENPVPIIIPCHRVVSSNGLGGYSGQTEGKLFDIKTWLLKHENNL